MRVFIAVIILIFGFQSFTKADDISDFQIEGISIGDSLLDYFRKSEINNNLATYYKNNEYSSLELYKDEGSFELKQYDHLVASFKTIDSKFKILGLSGVTWYQKTINQCYQDMKGVINDISQLIINISPTKIKTIDFVFGKNTYSRFDFNSGHAITVQCTDYDSKHENYWDHLRIAIDTDEWMTWVDIKAYN